MFFKSRQDDLEEIETLSLKYEKQVSKTFLESVKSLKDDESIKIIREFLELGRIDLAEKYLDEQDSFLFPLFMTIFLAAGALYSTIFSRMIGAKGLVFDPTEPKSAEEVRFIVENIVNEMKQKNKETLRYIVLNGQLAGQDARLIAENLKRSFGLTVKQLEAIDNYRKLLENGSKEALRRSLRDDKFDDLLRSKKPLTQSQIDMMVNAYRHKMIAYRAEVIGRTDTGDVINTAIERASNQLANKAGIAEYQLVKEWRSMRDKKVRFTHKQHVGMDGQVVGINESFVSPSGARLKHPHDGSAPISETANCRCRMLVYVKPEDRI